MLKRGDGLEELNECMNKEEKKRPESEKILHLSNVIQNHFNYKLLL